MLLTWIASLSAGAFGQQKRHRTCDLASAAGRRAQFTPKRRVQPPCRYKLSNASDIPIPGEALARAAKRCQQQKEGELNAHGTAPQWDRSNEEMA
jgi:hypothetical protein